jgi:hypothetical protein
MGLVFVVGVLIVVLAMLLSFKPRVAFVRRNR